MGKRINLLRGLPTSKRNLKARRDGKSAEVVRLSREFGELYFDGPREYGYGGYRYDGRWVPVAQDIVAHFNLKSGDRVLDVGCAKGFLVKDLLTVCPGLEVFGVDISTYALTHCEPEVIGRLHRGSADDLPFPDNSFSAVISINTVHNLDRTGCVQALREMERLAQGRGFLRVDSYSTPEQRVLFEDWVLTARFHDYPSGWVSVFEQAGYTGDYDWTILQ
ncbi:class I SAM-dependent methyltransferase [Alphaproteobacteria bacterium]|nr:class I SAM-dependent methyltransferase [Alphaproteobacteria bacterium]